MLDRAARRRAGRRLGGSHRQRHRSLPGDGRDLFLRRQSVEADLSRGAAGVRKGAAGHSVTDRERHPGEHAGLLYGASPLARRLDATARNHLKRLIVSVSTILQLGKPGGTADDTPKQARVAPTANAERHGLTATPVQTPANPSPRSMLVSATILGLAIVAAAGLWSYMQRPAPVVTQQQPKSAPAPAVTQQQPAPASAPAVTQQQPPSAPAPSTGAATTGCSSPICGNWQGAGSTGSTQFGGSPYCTYAVSLEKPALSVSIDEFGQVLKASLVLTMVESIVGSCPYAPLGTQPHSYQGGGTTNGTNVMLELNPAPGNKPSALAKFNGAVVNGRLAGTLTVHRINIGGNLAWTVESSVR